MKEIKILPSLLAADFSNLPKAVGAVEGCAAVGGLHCDVMDGHFVPNITFGPMIIAAVRRLTELPLRVHLMIEHPERYIEDFAKAGAYSITVHAEACKHMHRTIQQIKAAGCKTGIALNPSTPICAIEEMITYIDCLVVMTVNPGFGGQSFIQTMLPKIARARTLANDAGVDLDIVVDGGIDVTTAPGAVEAGANLLVAGTSVYGNSGTPAEACEELIGSTGN